MYFNLFSTTTHCSINHCLEAEAEKNINTMSEIIIDLMEVMFVTIPIH
jgi:hypothetical protein